MAIPFRAQGSGGVAGNAKGMAKVRLSPDGAGTMLAYQVEAQVGGRMAQLGGPLIDATAKNLAEKFFTKFGEVVGGEAAPAAAGVAVAAPLLLRQSAAASRRRQLPQACAGRRLSPGPGPSRWVWRSSRASCSAAARRRTGGLSRWSLVVLAAAGAGYDAGRRSGGSR